MPLTAFAQQFPSADENIPYLITFGKSSQTNWGDDDFSQTFFMIVPAGQKQPVYIRVFDPEVGGKADELNGDFNTQVKFSVYGGKEAFTHVDARSPNPTGKYNSGNLLASHTFGDDAEYDQQWYTFGPFNPSEGEYVPEKNGYIFKVICDGQNGDDGNLYRYFLSTRPNENMPIEGANAFTYEYTFRMPDNNAVCHIYPFVDRDVLSIQQHNFDWDSDGIIRIVSVARKGENVSMSGDGTWTNSRMEIVERERNTSLDIQLIRSQRVNNNNLVFKVANQYNQYQPFYSIPIGGKPAYKAVIKATPQ